MRISLLTVAAITLWTTAISAQVQFFSGRLTGDQETPPIATTAVGWVDVIVHPGTGGVRVFAHARGLTATAAHLHAAAPGASGPVLVALTGGPQTWTGNGLLSPAQVAGIQAGNSYVNLHTAAHPGGEIRAQVSTAKSSRFTAILDGGQANPTNNSAATGEAVAFLHEPDNVLIYRVSATGLSANAAHFHRGAPGVNGPVVVPMNGAATRWCGASDRLSASEVQDLKNGLLYVNVHTAAFPGGEIRGQVVAADAADFRASLDGSVAVPPVSTSARGEACMSLQPDGSLHYTVRINGLTPTAAHFHRAAAGSNGPVEFPLNQVAADRYEGATAPLSAVQRNDLRSGLWYINIHTAANPGGEIRGQVGIGALPATFGGACPLGGAAPEIGANGLACRGLEFEITVDRAPSTRPAVLLFGFSRIRSPILGRLPTDLSGIGATSCFLLHDNPGLSIPGATDALGCAAARVPLPFAGFSQELYAQWFVLAPPGTNPLGVIASNGLAFAPQ